MIPEKRLLLEPELLDECVVTALIRGLEVAQVRTAISDHLEKSATRMKILRIFLQMLRELVNLLR